MYNAHTHAGTSPRSDESVAITTDGEPQEFSVQAALQPAIGRYLVLRQLGEGGLSVVYEAYDPKLDRRIAIKILKQVRGRGSTQGTDLPTQDLRRRSRLIREAQAMARLSHSNVVPIFDVGLLDSGDVFLAMELIDGETLSSWLTQDARPEPDAVIDRFIAAGRGLAAAHRAGFVHRDFKPENVFVGADGRICVGDFGLVGVEQELGASEPDLAGRSTLRQLDRESSRKRTRRWEYAEQSLGSDALTCDGDMLGTPAFASPEQLCGEPAGPTSDIYSFCASVYQGLCGRRPFEGRSPADIHGNILRQHFTVVHWPPKIPPSVRKIILRGLKYHPSERPQNMEEILRVLVRCRRQKRGLIRLFAASALCAAIGATGVDLISTTPHANFHCPSPIDRTHAVWNTSTQQKIHAQFLKSEVPIAPTIATRIQRRVQKYIGSWNEAYDGACEAYTELREREEHQPARETANELRFDQTMVCLNEQLEALDTLSLALQNADSKLVLRSERIIDSLADPKACLDHASDTMVNIQLPTDPNRRLEFIDLHRKLVQLELKLVLEDPVTVEPKIKALLPRIEKLADPVLLAEGYLLLGRCQTVSDPGAAYRKTLPNALSGALRAGLRPITATIANYLAGGIMLYYRDEELAHEYLRFAEAVARAQHNDPRITSHINRVRGEFAMSHGQYEQAIEHFKQELEDAKAAKFDKSIVLPDVLFTIALTYHSLHDGPSSIQYAEQALTLIHDLLGPNHPYSGYIISFLSVVHSNLGNLNLALQLGKEGLNICIGALGDVPACNRHRYYLSWTYGRLLEHQNALNILHERLVRADPKLPLELLEIHFQLASTYARLGQGRTAVEHGRVAVGYLESFQINEPSARASAFCSLGEALTATGELDEADKWLTQCEKALETPGRSTEFVLDDFHHARGVYYRRKADFPRAYDSFSRALQQRRINDGPELDNPNYASDMLELAHAARNLKQLDQADELAKMAEFAMLRAVDERHHAMSSFYQELGEIALARGDYQQAQTLLWQGVSLFDPDNGDPRHLENLYIALSAAMWRSAPDRATRAYAIEIARAAQESRQIHASTKIPVVRIDEAHFEVWLEQQRRSA